VDSSASNSFNTSELRIAGGSQERWFRGIGRGRIFVMQRDIGEAFGALLSGIFEGQRHRTTNLI